MPRPACPRCGDHFSVANVSALWRHAALPTHAAHWQPPAAPGTLGRYLATALLAGVLLFIVTGFALLWVALALCVGVLAELLAVWEQPQAYSEYRQARQRWNAAYYCATHDLVFWADEPGVYPSEQLGRLVWAPPAPASGPGLQPPYQERRGHSA